MYLCTSLCACLNLKVNQIMCISTSTCLRVSSPALLSPLPSPPVLFFSLSLNSSFFSCVLTSVITYVLSHTRALFFSDALDVWLKKLPRALCFPSCPTLSACGWASRTFSLLMVCMITVVVQTKFTSTLVMEPTSFRSKSHCFQKMPKCTRSQTQKPYKTKPTKKTRVHKTTNTSEPHDTSYVICGMRQKYEVRLGRDDATLFPHMMLGLTAQLMRATMNAWEWSSRLGLHYHGETTGKTPEGRSATFWVQVLRFFLFLFLFCIFPLKTLLFDFSFHFSF